MTTWTVYTRDQSGDRTGQLDDFQQLDLVLRWNAVGSWVLNCPASTLARNVGTRGGIVVQQDSTVVFSGSVEQAQRTITFAADDLQLSGASDDVRLGDELCYPEAPALTTDSSAYDSRSGQISTVMRAYVEANCGVAASSYGRQSVIVSADPLLGSIVSTTERFSTVLDTCQRLSLMDGVGNIGFRVRDRDLGFPSFEVFQAADRRQSAIFSLDLGTCSLVKFTENRTKVNVAVEAGGGQGTARTFVTVTDSASVDRWRTRRVFKDARDTSDTTILTQRGNAALADGASVQTIEVTPFDSGSMVFGTHWNVGDLVTVVVGTDRIVQMVREVHIKLTPDGAAIVTPTIGTPGAGVSLIPDLFRVMSRTTGRVASLERNV